MRAIDRHEDAICDVLAMVADEGKRYDTAVRNVAHENGLTPDRLDQLVGAWCAIAGLPWGSDWDLDP